MLGDIRPDAGSDAHRVALKLLIWRGIASRLGASGRAGVLVDPDACEVIDAARSSGAVTAMALERSGQRWLSPDRPLDALAALVERHQPTYGKILLRWHPADPSDRRADQVDTIRRLDSVARDGGARVMLELLVPPAGTDVTIADASPETYRSEILPVRLADSIRQLADAAIVPDIWKVDGLDRHGAAEVVGEAVASTSAGNAGIVVLGAGRGPSDLERWFAATAGIPGYCGFAVGRSIWWDAIRRHVAGEIDADVAVDEIGAEFEAVVDSYQRAVEPT